MLKKLAIFVLMLFVLTVQAYPKTDKAQNASKHAAPSLPVAPVTPQKDDSQNLQPKADTHINADVRVISSPAKDRYDKAAFWINVVLAVIGICGIVAAVLTIRKLERQTKATEDSAKAALLNAQALITSERPWLLISIESYGVSLEDETPLSPVYIVKARNQGRTPAELIEGHCSCKLQSAYGFTPSDDMFDPFYAPNENLTVAGAEFLIRKFVPDAIVSEKDMEGMEPKMLYVYGKLLYWDTFKDRNDPRNVPYLTRWSFTYDLYRKQFHRTAGPWPKNT